MTRPLTGQHVDRVESRGKWLLMHFSGGATLATHMLMSGSWHIYRPGERWQQPRATMRIVIENAEYIAVGFNVPVAEMQHRRIAGARRGAFLSRQRCARGEISTADAALERIAEQPGDEIGDMLLNQRMMAGVGNVFKSEACFVAGIHPFARVGSSRGPNSARDSLAHRNWGRTFLKIPQTPSSPGAGPAAAPRTLRSRGKPMGLRAQRRAVPQVRRAHSPAHPGIRRARHLLVPRCQPMPDGSDVDG